MTAKSTALALTPDPTKDREAIIRRLFVMAVEALSHDGRPIRSRRDAQVLIAAARLLKEEAP